MLSLTRRQSRQSRPAAAATAMLVIAVCTPAVAWLVPFEQTPAGDPPGPPRSVAVSVHGDTVTLSWAPPVAGEAMLLYYLVQAGSAPGAIDHGTYNVGLTTTVTAPVPPGRYYVRVFAVNPQGAGPPSQDLAFTVGPTAPRLLHCVAFGPYIAPYSPIAVPPRHPPADVIDALVARIAAETEFNCLMTFGVLGGLDYTFEAARRRGLKVIAILWLEGTAIDDETLALGIARARDYRDTIVAIACGSELRARRGAAVAAQIVDRCVRRLRAAGVEQPIGTNDTWWSLCNEQWPCRAWPALTAMNLDWIGANTYAWWENRFSNIFPCITAQDAPAFHLARVRDVAGVYAPTTTIATEFGWPAGPDGYGERNDPTGAPGCGVASPANQRLVVDQSVALFRQYGINHVVFSAFREAFKIVEGLVGPWWGILEDPPLRGTASEFVAVSLGPRPRLREGRAVEAVRGR